MDVFWFIPTHGDSRYLGTSLGAREAGYDYFRQVAVAADTLGYDGVLLPTGRSCEDAWVVASSLIGATSRLKFLVAIRPGVSSPQFSARMAATFDRLSQGRLLVNVVTGGDPGELEGDGVFVSHDERYAITADYLKIWRGILAASHEGAGYSHDGEKLVSKGGKVLYPPTQKPYPPLYFGGSSEAAHELAAEQLDVYLTWGEPPEAVARKIADVRERAARHGRSVKFGIRLHVIVRETEAAAWAAADELISHLSEDTVNAAQAAFARMDSEGQRRMAALHGGKLDDGRGGRSHLEIAPTCGPAWAWCAAARARPWWATRRPWRRASRSTPSWASTPSSSQAIRTWKSRTASPSWCFRCCPARAVAARAIPC